MVREGRDGGNPHLGFVRLRPPPRGSRSKPRGLTEMRSVPVYSIKCVRLRPAEISPLSIPSQTSPISPGYKTRLLIRGKFPELLSKKKRNLASNLSIVIPCGGREPSRKQRCTRPSGDGGALAHPEVAAAHPPAGSGGGTSTRRRRQRRHDSLTTPLVDTSSSATWKNCNGARFGGDLDCGGAASEFSCERNSPISGVPNPCSVVVDVHMVAGIRLLISAGIWVITQFLPELVTLGELIHNNRTRP
jgi:hypothetical protein